MMLQTVTKLNVVFIFLFLVFGCNKEKPASEVPAKTFSKETAHELTYENLSILIEDMQRFTKSLKPLNRQKAEEVDNRYTGVFFELKQKPLFLNVYPDPENKRVVFLIVPKDPGTGSTYLLKFDKSLPVVNSDTVEIQIRLEDSESPLTCLMPMQDSEKYVQEVQSHLFVVRYKLFKKFLQSGTFDFDGLTIPTYRTRGVPFVVLDLADAELTDTTAKISCQCRQS